MKSLLIWLAGITMGAVFGYCISLFLPLNLYIAIAAGAIIGSSAAITINLQRGKVKEFDPEEPEKGQEDENFPKNSTQTTS
ncbi:MAG: hypothetical protein WD059_07300 [Balneolaceae bacterium]